MWKHIRAVAALYKIRVVRFSEPLPYKWGAEHINWGPQGSGFSPSRLTVYAPGYQTRGDPVSVEAAALHELVHLVLHESSVEFSEGFALMPFEWKLAEYIAEQTTPSRGADFLDEVSAYQEGTSICLGHEMDSTDRTRQWWKKSLRNARALGVLDRQGRPTFRHAAWTRQLEKAAALAYQNIYYEDQ